HHLISQRPLSVAVVIGGDDPGSPIGLLRVWRPKPALAQGGQDSALIASGTAFEQCLAAPLGNRQGRRLIVVRGAKASPRAAVAASTAKQCGDLACGFQGATPLSNASGCSARISPSTSALNLSVVTRSRNSTTGE